MDDDLCLKNQKIKKTFDGIISNYFIIIYNRELNKNNKMWDETLKICVKFK